MYFNWSVLIPPSISGKAPAELYFHPSGYSYAQPGKKAMRDSIQLAPHDYPPSGWYGFNNAWGTLKNLTDGVVSNHTQRRIIAFLDWAKQTLPIDPDRVLCTGADGAAALRGKRLGLVVHAASVTADGDHAIDDVDGGNGDLMLDPGERVTLQVTLRSATDGVSVGSSSIGSSSRAWCPAWHRSVRSLRTARRSCRRC